MGWGDELMAAGQAREIHKATGRKVQIIDRHGYARTHEAWIDNPHIVQRGSFVAGQGELLRNGPGYRPYIKAKHNTHWEWSEWKCPRGDLFLTEEETRTANLLRMRHQLDRFVLIEPNLKAKASPNKSWGQERWVRLVELMRERDIRPIQIGPAGTRVISGAQLVETPTFRIGCALLAHAKTAVLHEGGLHHAAAALGLRVVVIYGGFISPKQTGYDFHVNLFTGGEPCGQRLPCRHCAVAMEQIRPEEVLNEMLQIYNGDSHHV